MKKGFLKPHLDFEGQFQTGADGANHPEKGHSMSGRALWEPKQLESWDWREAIVEERQAKPLPFEAWTRPDAENLDQNLGGAFAPRPSVAGPQILTWIGFSVAALAAMVLVLSLIYGQLESALTGFPTTPLLPIGVLATSFVTGVGMGTLGLVADARRTKDTDSDRWHEPDTSIAA